MMLAFLNNVTSAAVVMACWWLAHQYSLMPARYHKFMAVVYALLGMSILMSMGWRLSGYDPVVGGIVVKSLIAAILIYVARFIRRNYDIG